jgi:hypothetical protein
MFPTIYAGYAIAHTRDLAVESVNSFAAGKTDRAIDDPSAGCDGKLAHTQKK